MPMHLAECPVPVSLCSLLVSNREYDRSPVGKQQVAVAVFDVGFSEFRIPIGWKIDRSSMALAMRMEQRSSNRQRVEEDPW
jgi:hypothetical protein